MAGLRGGATALRDAIRTQLWPLPTAGIVAALALGIGLPRLDARLDDHLSSSVTDYLFGGDAGAARTVLDAIASSLITVTSLTFSLTVVTLQLASSQFSPRLLRTFTRDMFVQATLAIFLATFVYALTVLRSVRSASDGEDAGTVFVPRISVTVGFVLAVLSVLGLVLFLAHLARQIRVENMLEVVHADAADAVEQTLVDHDAGHSHGAATVTSPPHDAVVVPAARSGFLVHVDEQALCEAAVRADAVVLLAPRPGASVIAGTPMSCFWPVTAHVLDHDTEAELTRAVRAAVTVGFERTATQDVALGLRQLTDVATKALSPGINDPTTAVHALGHSAALLCQLAGKDLGPKQVRDDEGTVRAVLGRPSLADLVELAVAQPRRYGAADPDVLARLFGLLRELAWVVRPEHHHVVTGQLTRLRATAAEQDFDDTERTRLSGLGRLVDAALAREWPMTEGDS